MNDTKSLAAMVVIVALLGGLWGCSSLASESRGPSPGGINPTQAARLPANHPPEVTVALNGGTAAIKWRGTGEDVARYTIFRTTADADDWRQLTTVSPTGDNRGWYEFNDTNAPPGVTYIYGVIAVNTFGTESAMRTSDGCTISFFRQQGELKECDAP